MGIAVVFGGLVLMSLNRLLSDRSRLDGMYSSVEQKQNGPLVYPFRLCLQSSLAAGTPLTFARHAVTIAVHLGTGALLDEEGGLRA